MTHFALPYFWQHYRQLPNDVQRLADKSFALLKNDPHHASLRLQKAGRAKQLWSVRVGMYYIGPWESTDPRASSGSGLVRTLITTDCCPDL